MSQQTTSKLWEPVFARDERGIWRLEYSGCLSWILYHRDANAGREAPWNEVISCDLKGLTTWAQMRWRSGNGSLPKELGVLASGSYERRLQRLRKSLIKIGYAEYYDVEGDVGTSFLVKNEVHAYAELGNHGGVDVLVRYTQQFSSDAGMIYYQADRNTLEEIEQVLTDSSITPYCRENTDLLDMLDSVTNFEEVQLRQTFVRKPKGRGCGYRVLVCMQDETNEQWELLECEIREICNAMKFVKENGIEVDWNDMLGGEADLYPSLWKQWADSYEDCYTDHFGLFSSFPGTYRTSETTEHQICSFTSYGYFVLSSHEKWLVSCFGFVAQRLYAFVEGHECVE